MFCIWEKILFLALIVTCTKQNDECLEEFPTVVVSKARGRLGNHVWLQMRLLVYELRTNNTLKSYVTEESRWILNEYFKNYQDSDHIAAEKKLCGYASFFKTFENYLDNKIVDYYQEKSGTRLDISKPDNNYISY